ncbi:MAG: DUF3127 domain-containing protein [Chitinophagales bacterium]|nr:DUF3127 domain-containing protein [Chitinophagales bacterium]
MQFKGKVVELLPLQSGVSRAGNNWKKQFAIVEKPNGNYDPKKICLVVWGDSVDNFRLQVGAEYEFSIDIESREFNGKWYTDVRAWKAVPAQQNEYNQDYQPDYSQEPVMSNSSTDASVEELDDDLPF